MKFIIFSLLLFISCSNVQMIKKAEPLEPVELVVQTGKVAYISIDLQMDKGPVTLSCENSGAKTKYDFLVDSNGKTIQGYLVANYFSKDIQLACFINKKHVANLSIKEFPYKREYLKVSKKKVDLSKKDLDRAIREKEIKKKIYINSASEYLFQKPFRLPIDSFVTSYYGKKRIFNNKKQSQHLGNDFRAKVGTEIPVANDGKVVFVGDLFFSGNLVAVDHGMDIFTVYAHLSRIDVKKGDMVKQGDIIGLAGKTGRVSGPHLHWGVKMNGHWIDGFSLIEESKKFKYE